MAFISGDVRKANAAFLIVLTPILARLWYEAVIWRLEQGPQMLGFQVLHLAAGGAYAALLAPILLISLLATEVYIVWVLLIVVLRFIPKLRRGLTNVRFAVAGAICYFAFARVAEFLQRPEVADAVLLTGAAVMVALVLAIFWLIYLSLRKTAVAPAV